MHGEPVASETINVQRQKNDQQCRQNSGMHGEEPRQRQVAVFCPTLGQNLSFRTDDRRRTDDIGRHSCGIVSLLIPRQQVTCE